MPNGAKHWVFTLNNYTNEEMQSIADLGGGDAIDYLIFGRETGDTGTPHLQGYVCFRNRYTLQNAKARLGGRCHLEQKRGTPKQASDYCKKDGDYEEFGTLPPSSGKRSDWDAFLEWVKGLDHRPSEKELWESFPGLYGRYRDACRRCIETFRPSVPNVQGDLREWQSALVTKLQAEPDDRSVLFVVDEQGAAGKTWLVKYFLKNVENVQILKIGKRDDLAHTVNAETRLFLVDVPRNSMQYLQYSVLEMIKDQLVFSPKYDSCMKVLEKPAHVVVFCNEHPDMGALTGDRYEIIHP